MDDPIRRIVPEIVIRPRPPPRLCHSALWTLSRRRVSVGGFGGFFFGGGDGAGSLGGGGGG
ncbi:MAG: hypothetical protein M3P42_05010, partial [Actinomycetota bacterium]|nr:hypothetical protein [Actinomycetota bacterium]